jgi:hypothetical protein
MKKLFFISFFFISIIISTSGCTVVQPAPAPTPATRIFINQGPAINSNYQQNYTVIRQNPQAQQPYSLQSPTIIVPNLYLSTGIGIGRGGHLHLNGIGIGAGFYPGYRRF